MPSELTHSISLNNNNRLNSFSSGSDLSHSTQQTLKQKHDEILSNIESSKFSWLHIRALLISGIGFFTVIKKKHFFLIFVKNIILFLFRMPTNLWLCKIYLKIEI